MTSQKNLAYAGKNLFFIKRLIFIISNKVNKYFTKFIIKGCNNVKNLKLTELV